MVGNWFIFGNSKRFENEARNSKNPNFYSSAFIIEDIDSKISHLTPSYRWPQFVRQHLCSISFTFAARWRKLVYVAVFLPKIRISATGSRRKLCNSSFFRIFDQQYDKMGFKYFGNRVQKRGKSFFFLFHELEVSL